MAAAATYGIVVYKAYRARLNTGAKQQSALVLAADENVQYLCMLTATIPSQSAADRTFSFAVMALIWLYSRQVPLALLPFTVYSVFHVATYTRTNIIPTLQPPKSAPASTSPAPPASPKPPSSQSPLANSIGRFVKEYYDASMTLVALLEIALWFRVLLSAFTFTKGSWILLVIYSAFLRARYAQSQFVQGAFAQAVARIDAQVQNQSMPPAVRQGWETAKGFGRKAVDATDPRRYLGGSNQHGVKKPQ